jgi:thiol:disulfide interchange protein DsbD
MGAGWHTYWKNPGDSGLATRIHWDLPDGLTAGPVLWPTPEAFGEAPVVNYGYGGDVWLLVEVAVAPSVSAGSTVRLGASVHWLECREICRPGRSRVEIELPVRREPPAPNPAAPLFERARARLPATAAGWTLRATAGAQALRLMFRAPRAAAVDQARFLPDQRLLLDHAARQYLKSKDGTYVLELARDLNRVQPVERLTGVLVTQGRGRTQAVQVDIPVVHKGE